jgi:hypothetical protein
MTEFSSVSNSIVGDDYWVRNMIWKIIYCRSRWSEPQAIHSQHEQLFIVYDLPLDLRESALSISLLPLPPPRHLMKPPTFYLSFFFGLN